LITEFGEKQRKTAGCRPLVVSTQHQRPAAIVG
jgi:hypothetical protein